MSEKTKSKPNHLGHNLHHHKLGIKRMRDKGHTYSGLKSAKKLRNKSNIFFLLTYGTNIRIRNFLTVIINNIGNGTNNGINQVRPCLCNTRNEGKNQDNAGTKEVHLKKSTNFFQFTQNNSKPVWLALYIRVLSKKEYILNFSSLFDDLFNQTIQFDKKNCESSLVEKIRQNAVVLR